MRCKLKILDLLRLKSFLLWIISLWVCFCVLNLWRWILFFDWCIWLVFKLVISVFFWMFFDNIMIWIFYWYILRFWLMLDMCFSGIRWWRWVLILVSLSFLRRIGSSFRIWSFWWRIWLRNILYECIFMWIRIIFIVE